MGGRRWKDTNHSTPEHKHQASSLHYLPWRTWSSTSDTHTTRFISHLEILHHQNTAISAEVVPEKACKDWHGADGYTMAMLLPTGLNLYRTLWPRMASGSYLIHRTVLIWLHATSGCSQNLNRTLCFLNLFCRFVEAHSFDPPFTCTVANIWRILKVGIFKVPLTNFKMFPTFSSKIL